VVCNRRTQVGHVLNEKKTNYPLVGPEAAKLEGARARVASLCVVTLAPVTRRQAPCSRGNLNSLMLVICGLGGHWHQLSRNSGLTRNAEPRRGIFRWPGVNGEYRHRPLSPFLQAIMMVAQVCPQAAKLELLGCCASAHCSESDTGAGISKLDSDMHHHGIWSLTRSGCGLLVACCAHFEKNRGSGAPRWH
jgi:hypothetical protein